MKKDNIISVVLALVFFAAFFVVVFVCDFN